MQFECIENHIFSGISDCFILFLTDALAPLIYANRGMISNIGLYVFNVYPKVLLYCERDTF